MFPFDDVIMDKPAPNYNEIQQSKNVCKINGVYLQFPFQVLVTAGDSLRNGIFLLWPVSPIASVGWEW